jgi:molecular chaperone GrpE (heat shock protein)
MYKRYKHAVCTQCDPIVRSLSSKCANLEQELADSEKMCKKYQQQADHWKDKYNQITAGMSNTHQTLTSTLKHHHH